MATVTPNFNWPVPTSTDLVKDGATAIEALGDSIDASLVDLKGGTTGQVLSKTTNTDMDFTWVTTDDANAIQNSIVDAKGDLIAATANDTPARLAVGANSTMLVANSAESTGLKWTTATDQFPWQAWTPTYTNISIGNGIVSARYQQIGKTINLEFSLFFGSTTTISAPARISTPVTASMAGNTSFYCNYLDSGTAEYYGGASLPNGTLLEFFVFLANGTYLGGTGVGATAPFTWTTNDKITLRASYEAV